jgi:hypothetical protein
MITTTAAKIGYGPLATGHAASDGMKILLELDATRLLIINNQEINPAYAAYLMTGYERDLRNLGIDPDLWEGIR